MKNRTSELGKLYELQQANKHLDKLVFDVKSILEFHIKCNDSLPIDVNVKLSSNVKDEDLNYILEQLKVLGVHAVIKEKSEYRLVVKVIELD